ncbi:MAG TPA: hypothetical protein VFZ76_11095 [Anaerolineales bacterium]
MRRNFYVLWGVVLMAALLAAACSPSAASAPQQTQEPAQATTAADVAEPTAVEAEPGATQPQAGISPEGAREDIPIMEAARGLQILRQGGTITYEVDTDIDTVVSFYQEELPNYGWELAGPPDSALASIATMLRENDSGDRMTINLQENQLGGFVRVNISVVRAN